MCGRFALYSKPSVLFHRFSTETIPEMEFAPRYNIAPTQNILIVREDGNKRQFVSARWGLIPYWAKSLDASYATINARAETVAVKPAFRDAFKRRRCLIPADGYYEWQTLPDSKIKQPWFITLSDQLPMALAGLWEAWRNPNGEQVESCAIIVTDANPELKPIHDRMPVILPPGLWEAWLTTASYEASVLQEWLKPFPDHEIAAWPVSKMVNNPKNDSKECIERSAGL